MRTSTVALCVALAGALGPAAEADAEQRAKRGSFVSVCAFSHRAADDPIVMPGAPGRSHSHDFAGNTTTNAFSTLRSLRAGTTTCDRGADTAAYWVPTLTHGGAAVAPRVFRVYYRPAIRDQRRVRPFPRGLRMIAGDGAATAPQPLSIASWACSVDGPEIPVGPVPTCLPGRPLRLRIVFPSCWDGRNLDASDHKRHMAYPKRGACPRSHRVAVPKIVLSIRYWITGADGVSLACGSAVCGHADFFNAWRPSTLRRLVRTCINRGVECRSPSGTGARRSARRSR